MLHARRESLLALRRKPHLLMLHAKHAEHHCIKNAQKIKGLKSVCGAACPALYSDHTSETGQLQTCLPEGIGLPPTGGMSDGGLGYAPTGPAGPGVTGEYGGAVNITGSSGFTGEAYTGFTGPTGFTGATGVCLSEPHTSSTLHPRRQYWQFSSPA